MFKSTLKFQSKEFDIRFVDYEIKRDHYCPVKVDK